MRLEAKELTKEYGKNQDFGRYRDPVAETFRRHASMHGSRCILDVPFKEFPADNDRMHRSHRRSVVIVPA